MITPHELRIGNYVNTPNEAQNPFRINGFEYLNGVEQNGKVCIYAPPQHAEGVSFPIRVHPLTWDIEDIYPIPLSEDWLIKLGFKKEKESRYGNKFVYPVADWGFTVENSFGEGKWFFGHEYYDAIKEEDNNIPHNFCFDLQYVHTLQNIIYSLTSTELTIKP